MVKFVIVGGKAKKAKGRFGGETGRNYDRSFERRRLKLTSRLLVAAALEDVTTYESAGSQAPVSKPKVEKRTRFAKGTDAAPDFVVEEMFARPRARGAFLTLPRAVYHNDRKVVAYPGGICIQSARY